MSRYGCRGSAGMRLSLRLLDDLSGNRLLSALPRAADVRVVQGGLDSLVGHDGRLGPSTRWSTHC